MVVMVGACAVGMPGSGAGGGAFGASAAPAVRVPRTPAAPAAAAIAVMSWRREPARYAGAIDNVGGEMLAGLTRQMDFWGNIASVGLAGGAELHTTVMPFILRGVNLLGINSSATRREERLAVWRRISTDLTPRHLDRIAQRTTTFDELPRAFQAHIDGKVTGRTVVKIR